MLVTLNFNLSSSLNVAIVLVDEQCGLSTCLQVCPTDLRCPKVIPARCGKLAFLMGKQGLQDGGTALEDSQCYFICILSTRWACANLV